MGRRVPGRPSIKSTSDYHAPVTGYHWLSLLTCGGQLALAVIAFGRSKSGRLATVLGILALDLFTWNAADVAADLSTSPDLWHRVDGFASSLTMAFALHFMALFLAWGPQGRWLVRASYAYFGAIAAATVLVQFNTEPAWPVSLIAAVVPLFAIAVVDLLRHLRRTVSELERSRTRLVLMAIVVGVLFGGTDLARLLEAPVPRVSNVGTLASVVLLGIAALRFRLFDESIPRMRGVLALTLAVAGIGTYILVFAFFGTDFAMLGLATGVVTLVLLRIVRRVSVEHANSASRLEYDASIGRLAQAMTHDIGNPLAAAKAGVQFLDRELEEGRTIEAQRHMLELVESQIDAIAAAIERYKRLGRIEPQYTEIDAVELCRSTVESMVRTAPEGKALTFESIEDLVTMRADRDLLVLALENLVRNAFQSSDDAVAVTIDVWRAGPGVAIEIRDDGGGMSPRVQQQVLDDFFSTKGGSGLGLPMARRVAEAHGGRLTVRSEEGLGTKLRVWLPLGPEGAR